jgi:hypothetical protein
MIPKYSGGGWKYQNRLVMTSATTLASQPCTHHRISARRTDRRSTAKNSAITTVVTVRPEMFNWNSNKSTVSE